MPISLINVDAKIISKVLVLRIKHIMHTLIHHDQTAYVKTALLENPFVSLTTFLNMQMIVTYPVYYFQLILKKLSILLITLSCLQYLRNLALVLILFIGLGLYTMVQKTMS